MQSEGTNSSPNLTRGQLVGAGRYELKRMLDKGGMSSIWLAYDSQQQEHVALKFLPPEISNSTEALQTMQQETAKSRNFSHPNIIRIHDLVEPKNKLPFIVMEFVEGDNLYNLSGHQANGVFSWDQLKPWVIQLCDALEHAHEAGVIHHDIKPSNMMINRADQLKLADFGISMTVGESKLNNPNHVITGTLGYMSPQQLSGHPAHVTDDIHAFGATLYELLSGRRPFQSENAYKETLNDKPKPLIEVLNEQGITNKIPPEVGALIMACLAKDPSMRPASARSVAEWLNLKISKSRFPPPPPPPPAILKTRRNQAIRVAAQQKDTQKKSSLSLRSKLIILVLTLLGFVCLLLIWKNLIQ